jgi:hypothetical protein
MSSESAMLWAILVLALVLLLGIIYLAELRFHKKPEAKRVSQIKDVTLQAFVLAGFVFVIAVLGFDTGEGLVIYVTGRSSVATVQDRHTTDGFSETDYAVSYVYAVGGRTYQADQSVSVGIYNRLEPGPALHIRYLAASPVRSRLVGRHMDWMYQLVQATPAAGFCVLAIVTVISVARSRRKLVHAQLGT